MTIEPGEVIAVLAAATLLALEGLISQVRVMNQYTGWEQDLRASQEMGNVQSNLSHVMSNIESSPRCAVRGDHGGDSQRADCGSVLGGCL